MIVLLLLSVLPRDTAIRESVDLIELNHFYSPETGQPHIDQLIYYRWHQGRYEVLAWRMLKSPLMVPYRDHSNGGYTAVWVDEQHVLRVLRSKDFRETWTQYDVELADRELCPADCRRGLKGR